jgi:hypothetical protein
MRARTRNAGQAVGAAALACLALGCSTGTTSSGGSCLALMHFRGHVYLGATLRTHAPYTKRGEIPRSHLRTIGLGLTPACNDTNGSRDTAQTVHVARISRVDPSVAVAVLPRGDVYVRRGETVPGWLTRAPWIRWVG